MVVVVVVVAVAVVVQGLRFRTCSRSKVICLSTYHDPVNFTAEVDEEDEEVEGPGEGEEIFVRPPHGGGRAFRKLEPFPNLNHFVT